MAIQVEVGTFTVNTGSATTTVPTGFQGKALILFSHIKTGLTETANANFDFAIFDGTNGGNAGWSGKDAQSTSSVDRVSTANTGTGQFIWFLDNTVTVIDATGLVFNATPNFVITWNTTPSSAYEVSYILIGGTDITNVKFGKTNTPGAVQSSSVTGIGFKGDAIFIIHQNNTAANEGTNAQGDNGIGFAASSSKRWAWAGTVNDAQSSSANVKGQSYISASNVIISNHVGTIQTVADFTSFDSDGFTLNFTTSSFVHEYLYLVIKGGSWDAGVQAKPTSATAQTVTGMSFLPNLLGLFMCSATSLDTQTSNDISMFGAATSVSSRAYAGAYHNDAINTVAKSAGASTKILHEMNATADADFTSFNSDGWTITWGATGTAYQVAWFTAADTNAGSKATFLELNDPTGQEWDIGVDDNGILETIKS